VHWSDTAIILSVRKHGENSAVVRLLAREHGVYAGVVKSVTSKTNRGVIQPGNVVNATWNARLSEHLGMFKIELLKANAALIMNDSLKLASLSSACAMVEIALPERHPYQRLYHLFIAFLADLQESNDWMKDYVSLELDLLAEAGFGLDLSHCAATGKTDNLIYVSPKSGRAVSREAGEPYKDKLLALPGFLNNDIQAASDDIRQGLNLSGYFLEHWLLSPHNRKLPPARRRLLETLYKPAETL
jgi:DNA repair protein RecO (recombination protein O)